MSSEENKDKEYIKISRETADELAEDIRNLLSHHTYQGDFECGFCGQSTRQHNYIHHDEDCRGIKYLEALK